MFFIAASINSAVMSFLLSHPAQAQFKCRDLFGPYLLSRFDRREFDLLDRSEHMNGPLLEKIYSDLGPLRPDGVRIEMLAHLPYLQTRLDLDGKTVKLGLISLPEQKAVDVAVAHEVGHASFLQHLLLEIDGLRGNFLQITEAVLRKERAIAANPETQKAWDEIQAQAPTMSPEAHQKMVFEFAKKLGLDQIHDRKEQVRMMNYLLFPYNELYADLVAVLVFNDKKAVFNSIEKVKDRPHRTVREKPFHTELRERDFTQIINFKLWAESPEVMDFYSPFDPVRGVIGRLFLNDINSEQKSLLLRAFLNATRRHVQVRILRGENAYTNQHVATELNQEFLRLLVEEARNFGLKFKKRLRT